MFVTVLAAVSVKNDDTKAWLGSNVFPNPSWNNEEYLDDVTLATTHCQSFIRHQKVTVNKRRLGSYEVSQLLLVIDLWMVTTVVEDCTISGPFSSVAIVRILHNSIFSIDLDTGWVVNSDFP